MHKLSTDNTLVSLVREYTRPEFRTKPNKIDLRRANTVELQYLRGQLTEQKDKIRRLREEIEDEIKMLAAVIEDDKKESIGNIKRRISRLKGALEYRGRS